MIAYLSPRAEREMNSIDERWREEADYAPDLFRDELLAMIERLESTPTIGLVFDTINGAVVYRTLLKRSRYHVFYVITGDELEVLSIWSAQRKDEPDLGQKRRR